ncbi:MULTISPECIES: tetratricopeptide repeat protein [Bradyrhizobium]|jgi:protein O-GlcNAc transferase|uniref:tetratricopeptide repeat protein n=1 Tax=Bradyrhizobium TaxID=374 RepID=UPI0004B20AAA|nr:MULTISPECIES: glycosyltransferase family 41 protein [Bradyrhizobium]MCS3446891.1 putative O-linked N-acetylglucosamine transferase (SPINDLY family) [Bradyrhizobium elkanii]MCS3561976.1 putative O-linked N-acetylglucosamine transferase (SPINDLY family) [Bradyrhizobium elkanii]MCW2148186.1 putative O-linked N-acetylglucosamine transferase (SPINDLY family) [Bradyrhizobium elkanii]MCW2352729.1 putative O-linked N-acetylglucosamine transferase (SPINDLY family) [Bradyrhizobium elkanii]MCW2371912.
MPETGEFQKSSSTDLQRAFAQAVALHQRGQLAAAEKIYEDILRQQPDNFDALHLLGLISAQTGRSERGVDLIRRAIRLNGNVADAHSNLGNTLRALRRFDEALASFDRAIALRQDLAPALYNRGLTLADLGRHQEALASFDRVIALAPNHADAHRNRGAALRKLERLEEALASLDRAIALKPNDAGAHNDRGNVLNDLKRFDDALASYHRAPGIAGACYNRGNVLIELDRLEEAVASYDKAIALQPDYAEAYNNRGSALFRLRHHDAALASIDKSIQHKGDDAAAHANRGKVLSILARYPEALAAYDKAVALKPDQADIEGYRLHAKSHICDWAGFDAGCDQLIELIRTRNATTPPFLFCSVPSSTVDQLLCATRWTAKNHPPSASQRWRGERYDHDRIRIGYFSSDFCNHATSLLMAGMFECHDRSKFETVAISWSPNAPSEMRRRLEASFDRFVEVRDINDDEVADLIRQLEIDILVDLKGFTGGSRTRVLGRRPAPIQVNYLGYPGTLGAPFIDYIIAGRTVIPDHHREFYSEKVVALPNSYQANDDKRAISDRVFTRGDVGLAPTGFVFCCFNNNYKITPDMFDRWMRILGRVDGSMLWLLEANADSAANLRNEAVARGVAAERLVFAPRMSLPDHLARHRLAGLFLDSTPYNAHTTASDALWAGLPVLTILGDTFASRVAASLLHAVGLPELIAESPEAYERMAVDLATHPEKLAALRTRLAANRLAAPLFDTKRFTRHIEAAYTAMYERHRAGITPDHIVVPA